MIYEADSFETLKNIVDKNFGITIIPELATFNFSESEKKRLCLFKAPDPVRQISIITHREYIKHTLTGVLQESIRSVIPEKMKDEHKVKVLHI